MIAKEKNPAFIFRDIFAPAKASRFLKGVSQPGRVRKRFMNTFSLQNCCIFMFLFHLKNVISETWRRRGLNKGTLSEIKWRQIRSEMRSSWFLHARMVRLLVIFDRSRFPRFPQVAARRFWFRRAIKRLWCENTNTRSKYVESWGKKKQRTSFLQLGGGRLDHSLSPSFSHLYNHFFFFLLFRHFPPRVHSRTHSLSAQPIKSRACRRKRIVTIQT